MDLWHSDATRVDQWNHEADITKTLLAHPVHKRTAEGDSYEFYPGEVRLAKIMGMAVAGATNKALKVYDEITGLKPAKVDYARKGPFDLAKALDRLVPILRGAWTNNTERSVARTIDALTSEGAIRAGDYAAFQRLPTRLSIQDGMVAASKYYTNEYFSRIVLPAMVNDINSKITSGDPFDDTFYRALRKSMEDRLKSVPYWRTVANQAASRAYHYGMTRAGMARGYKGYRFTAVLDERTTATCRHLHGKTFWLADAVNHLEKVARAAPETIKDVAPWATEEDVKDMDAAMLTASGFMVPPLHANCRSTIVLTM